VPRKAAKYAPCYAASFGTLELYISGILKESREFGPGSPKFNLRIAGAALK
jgi:hypothetical protein